MLLRRYFVAPAVLIYTMVLSSDRIPCLTCCNDLAFFYLSSALQLIIGTGIVLQVGAGANGGGGDGGGVCVRVVCMCVCGWRSG